MDDFVKYALTQVQVQQEEESHQTTVVDFARLGISSSDGGGGGASDASSYSSAYSVEAVMTGTSTQRSIFAASLQMQAQKSTLVHGAPLWTMLDEGLNRCGTCAGVGLSIVPNGTQRLLLDTALSDGVNGIGGNIWLTAWKP